MDVDRVIEGEEIDEDGNSYNSKILKMQKKFKKLKILGDINIKL